MATSPRNIMYRKYLDMISFNVSTGTDFNEGDIVCYDTGTHMIRPITGTGDMDYQLGDVQGTSPVAYHTPSAARRNTTVGVNCGPHTVKLIARNVAPSINTLRCISARTPRASRSVAAPLLSAACSSRPTRMVELILAPRSSVRNTKYCSARRICLPVCALASN